MNFCTSCGKKVDKHQSFCTSCGAPYRQEKNKPNNLSTSLIEQVKGKISEINIKGLFSNKKFVIIGLSSVGIFVLLVALYFVYSTLNTPSAVADSFVEAVKEKDSEKVKEIINNGQHEIEVNEKEAMTFINYLLENPKVLGASVDSLDYQSRILEENPNEIAAYADGTDEIASLKVDGEKWGIFNNYVIEVKPIYAVITSDIDETQIVINEQEVGKAGGDEETFGPFLPGDYIVKAVYKGKYATLKQEQELKLSDVSNHLFNVNFYLEGQTITLYSNYEDAVLYVNGNSTDLTIGEAREFGPIPFDGTIKLHAEKEFPDVGVKKSEEVLVTEDMYDADLSIPYYDGEPMEDTSDLEEASGFELEEEKNNIIEVINKHYNSISSKEFEIAYNAFSVSRKSKFSLDNWIKGFEKNIGNEIDMVEVDTVDGTSAEAAFKMISRDQVDDGVLIQEWGGTWNLVKEDGKWVLNTPNIELLDSRTE